MTDSWSDRLNPIVVRDVRQGLRSRTFVATFTLLIGACLVGALVAASEADPGDHTGEGLFYTYTGFLYFVGCLLQPLGAFRAFAREREGEVWAPLLLSGMRARSILRGKIASQLVQGVLFASSIVPFLAFAYLLGGVSIIGMSLWLAGAFVAQSLLTTVAIAGATFADSKRNRWASQAFAGLILWFGLGWGISGLSLVGSTFAGGGTPVLAALFAFASWMTLLALVFEVAAAKLMAWGEDYVTGPRVALGAHVLAVLGLGASLSTDARGMALAYAIFLVGVFGFLGATDVPPPAGRWLQERRWMALRPGPLTGFGLFFGLELVLLLVAAALQVDGVDTLAGLVATLVGVVATSVACIRAVGPALPAQLVRVPTVAVGVAWVALGANVERESILHDLFLPFDLSDPAKMVPAFVLALAASIAAFTVLKGLEARATELPRG